MNVCKNRSFARKCGVLVLIIGLAVMVGSPLWSQAEERPAFVSDLMELLQEAGWTAEEARALGAQDVDWEKAEGADPEVVALALQFAKGEDDKMGPMEQALTAINLAQMAEQMEMMGIDELTVALAALQGVQDILTDIEAFRSGGLTGKWLGEAIRTKMHQRMSAAAGEHARTRMHERALQAQADRPNGLVPDIPASGDGLPGSGYSNWW